MEQKFLRWVKASDDSEGWTYGPDEIACPPSAVYRHYIWPNRPYTLSYWVDREVLTAHHTYMTQLGWQCEQHTSPFDDLEMED